MARFLKVEVLPALANISLIKKVKQPRSSPLNVKEKVKGRDNDFEFIWKVVDPNAVPSPPQPKPKKVVGEEVGVTLDYGHLNKRRQNARVGKVARDVELMKKSAWEQEKESKES